MSRTQERVISKLPSGDELVQHPMCSALNRLDTALEPPSSYARSQSGPSSRQLGFKTPFQGFMIRILPLVFDASGFSSSVCAHSVITTLIRQRKDSNTFTLVTSQDENMPRISSSDVQLAFTLARLYLEDRDFKNAENLFTKGLIQLKLRSQLPENWEVRMQIAAVKMHRGKYQTSFRELDGIKKQLSAVHASDGIPEHLYRCQRLLARCQLRKGEWEPAVGSLGDLEREHPQKSDVRLHRDLALAYAHLGQYEEARASLRMAQERLQTSAGPASDTRTALVGQDAKKSHQTKLVGEHDDQTQPISEEEKETRTQKANVLATKAWVDVLAGDYEVALVASSEALDSMNMIIQSRHLITLATSTFKAWCLAHDGRYTEAEKLCAATLKATTQALDPNHPLTLDARGCLVHVSICQGWFYNATTDGMSLVRDHEQAASEMGKDHPLSIHARYLLAKAHLGDGDYWTAKSLLDKVVAQAADRMGDKHPETLRYRSELARAHLHLGNVAKAHDLALFAVGQQFELHSGRRDPDLCRLPSKLPHETLLARVKTLLNSVLKRGPWPPKLHPFLASTLQLIANIEVSHVRLMGFQGSRAGLDTARNLLKTLLKFHTSSTMGCRILASSIHHDYPLAHLEGDDEPAEGKKRLKTAIEYLRRCYQDRKTLLGDRHLDTARGEISSSASVCL